MLILYFRLHPTPVGSAIRILSIHISLSLNIILFTLNAFILSLIILTSSNICLFGSMNTISTKKKFRVLIRNCFRNAFQIQKEYKIVPEREFLRFKSHPTFFRVVLYCSKVTISVFRIINTFYRFKSNN